MPGKKSDMSTILKTIMKSGGDAGKDEESGHNAGKDNEIQASSREGFGQASENVGSR